MLRFGFRAWLTALLLALASVAPAAAQITIPYTFVFETTIDQDQVNSNFTTLGNGALNRTGGTVTGAIASSGGSLTGSWAGGPTMTGAWTFSGSVTISGTCTGCGVNDATYITQTPNGTLSAEQALSALSSGIMRVATTTGVVTSLTDSAGIAANISDETGSGALVFGTAPTFTTSITLPLAVFNATASVIRTDSSDGSDSKAIQVAGGGAGGSGRGADLTVYGNEHGTNPGDALVTLGDVSGGQFRVSNGGDVFSIEESDGSATFTSSKATATFNFNGTAANGPIVQIMRSGNAHLQIGGYNAILGGGSADDGAVYGVANLWLESAGGLFSATINSDTTATAANMVIESNQLKKSTSSARFKTNIEPLTTWRWLLDVQPVEFDDRARPGVRRFGGLLAEDIAAHGPMAYGRPVFAGLDDQGRPEDVAYAHLTAPIIAAIQEHEARLNQVLPKRRGMLRALLAAVW